MKLRLFSLALLLLVSTFKVVGQAPFYHYFQDTLKPGYRISKQMDSVDVALSDYQTNLPRSFSFDKGGFQFGMFSQSPIHQFNRRYSSIAHVGLMYSMGSGANQPAGISYTQAISKKLFLQFDYRRNFTNEIMRSGGFESNLVDFKALYRGDRFASHLNVTFFGGKQNLNGGLLGDTLSEPGFDLIFQEVESATSKAVHKHVNLTWDNYISILKDSTIKTGVFFTPQLNIRNKRYQESLIQGKYSVFNYDSTETNDFWQRSALSLSAGYFFHTSIITINAGVKNTYWDYDNLIIHNDTNELSLIGDFNIQLRRGWTLNNRIDFNLIGALGEFQYAGNLRIPIGIGSFTAFADLKNAYPELYQRYYYANNLSYSWNNKVLQTQLKIGGVVDLKVGKFPISLKGTYTQLANNAWLIDTLWRQDTLQSVSLLQFNLRSDLSIGKLLIQPAVISYSGSLNNAPSLLANLRFGYNGTLFKAKKLKVAIGVDAGCRTAYQLVDYNRLLDAYVFSSKDLKYTAMPKLHAFANFDLGYFRWYLRFENIEQTWIKTVNMEAIGYPVVPFQLRFGVSWDLFN